jgi:hypothetical protein
LLKPWPLKPAVSGGFTIDDYTYDAAAGTLTAPRTSPGRSASKVVPRSKSPAETVHCASSAPPPRRVASCYWASTTTCSAHRQRAADEGFQNSYRQHRPMVDRSIAWLTRSNRRVPYRGVEKNNNWLHHRVAALNLRRLLTMGLSIENGTWVLA